MSSHAQKGHLSKNQGPVSRELSLSEWRHWQHKVLPTHVVDHSLRCQHFVKVMELIDGMREEKEVRTDVLVLGAQRLTQSRCMTWPIMNRTRNMRKGCILCLYKKKGRIS